ncbi:MAG: hypothetical protein QF704_14170, partial [Anaerolineales bacterium]|nr:hypothetical protein [Anaerolineales bacterium]
SLTLTSSGLESSSALVLSSGGAQFTYPTSVGSANQVLKTDASGTLSWANAGGGVSSAEMQAVENNVILNAFRMSMLTSTTTQQNQDSIMDEFRDEGGINTSTSTNEYYDGADFYTNDTTAGTSATEFEDEDGNTGHTATANGNATYNTSVKKFGASSIILDGGGSPKDSFTIPDHADWNFGTGAMTIDFWARFVSHGHIQVYQTASGNVSHINYISYGSESGNATMDVYENSSQTMNNSWEGNALSLDTWYHVAFIRGWGGNNNSMQITLNGTPIGNASAYSDSSSFFDVAAELKFVSGSGAQLIYDEVRVSNTARWTSDFSGSLPSSEYASDSNTKLLMHFNGAEATSDTTHNITLISNSTEAEFEPTVSKLTILAQNVSGTFTPNTDIKGYVSLDDGSNW